MNPLFTTGITYMDNYNLDNAAAFAAVIGRHPQIKRILCGDLHRAIDPRFAGTVAARPRVRRTRSALISFQARASVSILNRPVISCMYGRREAL